MKIHIIYDNEVYKKNIGLKSDWGFACMIDTGDETILFDTGAKGDILLNNINILGLDLSSVDKIVLSHEHWDHIGGLKALLPSLDTVELYRLGSQQLKKKIHVIDSEKSQEIAQGVYTTGRLSGLVDEQSLVLQGKKGCFVLVGCSHPGVEKILMVARQYGDIKGLIGGFHGFDNFNVLEDVDFICPCHCTAHKKELKKVFPEKISNCGVGKLIDINVVP